MNTKEKIIKLIEESIVSKQKMLLPESLSALENISQKITFCYKNGKKLVVFGNGGSASDAQHFTTEIVARFEKNRKALPALALTTNTSMLTAIGNDFGYDDIFSRQVEGLVCGGDVVIGISTSGNSVNVLKGLQMAKTRGAIAIGFSGGAGGALLKEAELCFCAPSSVTARVQECHILAIHILCSLLEEKIVNGEL